MNLRFMSFTVTGLGVMLVALGALFVASCAMAPDEGTDAYEQAEQDSALEEVVVSAERRPRRALRSGPALAISYSRAALPPAGALPPIGADEELWIVATPSATAGTARTDDEPGSGTLLARFPAPDGETGEPKQIPLPLRHTDVRAAITGYVSTVDVRQEFENPYGEKIEAVYLFPLPSRAAVSEFLMIIGERRIRGILRERQEAEALYRDARAQGYQASLLVQHRPNIFEQKVANIEPGKTIDVSIRYFHTLAYHDGWYSFVVPTVVGPRYNPPGWQNPVLAIPRARSSAEGGTAVEYLRPDERSGHDLSIGVTLDAGVGIEALRSSHEIVASRSAAHAASVTLAERATIPNRDFVLDFRVAGDRIKSNLLTFEDPESGQGYFTLMLYPPAGLDGLNRRPMEMVFVLDCSGSMSGRPLEQAKAAVTTALNRLRPGDTFQIIRFSDAASRFGAAPVPATPENLARARRYLASLQGSGGTRMIEGIRAALGFPHDPARLRFVSFMTDGYIGNEVEILAEVHRQIGDARIFSFGVGSAVNRYLLEGMAKEGRGAVAYLGPEDSAADVMGSFFERISHPALTDLAIDWGGMAVSDVYPARLPDLFVGRAVVVTGRYRGTASRVTVAGTTGHTGHTFRIDAGGPGDDPVIAKLWARLRIAELSDRQAWEDDPNGELESAIRSTALEHQLMSAFTSFVAVDASRRTEGDYGTTVHQAVPVPDGVRYETTVESGNQED